MSGSKLVSDTVNKVYFQVLSADSEGKDSSLTFEKAVLSKSSGSVLVDNIKQVHDGRASFQFIPASGSSYKLTVHRTSDSKQTFDLPAIDDKQSV